MNIYDVIPEISDNIIFKNADKDKVSQFLCDNRISLVHYKAGEVIFEPNDKNVRIGIVVDGSVEITSPSSSHKVLMKTSGRGAMFGVANLYAYTEGFPTRISARNDTEMLFIDADTFRAMIESDADIMSGFLQFLCRKVMYLNKKIESYTAGNTEKKLAYFIYENVVNGEIRCDMSISDMAVMLDMGRASLYRAFESLEQHGIILRDGKRITVTDIDKLKKFI